MALSRCAQCKNPITAGEDSFCRKCGRQLNLHPVSPPSLVKHQEPSTMQNTSTLAILALVLVFVVPIVGFILSFFALAEFKKHPNLKGRGYALAAFIVPIVAVLAILIFILIRTLVG